MEKHTIHIPTVCSYFLNIIKGPFLTEICERAKDNH